MMFLESPSQFAPVSKWEAWSERLKTFNPHDKTVVAEKQRAERIIARHRNPREIQHKPIPA
mgnify:CR=1 FL=1